MSKEFEIARLMILKAAKEGDVGSSRGFAWAHRIYPLNPDHLEETFEADFKVGREQVEQVLRAVDEGWRDDKLVTFYDLEGMGGNPFGLDRMELVNVLRLAFLDRRFDEKVWNKLVEPGSGPIESQGMTNDFEPNYDLYY